MKYTVYFEIYGKKLKVTIPADNEEQAKYIVLGQVKFHKVEKIDESKDLLNEIFGI